MLKAISVLAFAVTSYVVSFYSLRVDDLDNKPINFINYQGKKVLLVNIATESNAIYQLAQLEQFYQQHHDSIVIIGFPSNSFGNEPKTNAELKQFMQTNGITFPVAAKSSVTGSSSNMVFKWLANKMHNEVAATGPATDFQKFLINRKGMLVESFDSSINPLDTLMQNAIKTH